MPTFAEWPPNRLPLTHRVALLVLALLSIAVNARQAAWYFNSGPVSTDLRIFMTGVEMVRSGQGHELYQFPAQEAAQQRLYPQTKVAGLLPFNHLAYELLFYWPLSWLSYRAALIAWTLANLAIVAAISRLLRPYTVTLRQTTGLPLELVLLAFYPLVYVLGEGQDSLLFLLFVVLSLRCANAQRVFLAGFLLALALFKFHLVLLTGFLIFVLRRQWRSIAGLAVGGGFVGALSLLLVGPNLLKDYPAMLRTQETMTPWGFVPWFMPNLRGILQWWLSQWMDIGSILPIIFVSSVIVVIVGSWVIARCPVPNTSFLYAFAIPTTLLVSYHLHMQDLSLAILPILLLTEQALRRRVSRPWMAIVILAICGLFGFRLAAEPFQILLVRGCLLAIPLLLLWVAAGWVLSQGESRTPA